jgi:hypothetical protein
MRQETRNCNSLEINIRDKKKVSMGAMKLDFGGEYFRVGFSFLTAVKKITSLLTILTSIL